MTTFIRKESRKLTKKRVRKFDDKESTKKLYQLEEKYAEIKQTIEDKENEVRCSKHCEKIKNAFCSSLLNSFFPNTSGVNIETVN